MTTATTEPAAAAAPNDATDALPAPQSKAAIPGVGRHIPALDGVRGLAILLVMFHHLPMPVFGWLPSWGWTGVDLFFVLSGFLITGILYDAKGSEGYFRNFYMRRVLRIFPLYYGVLLVMVVILPLAVSHVGPLNHLVLARRPPALDEFGTLYDKQAWLWLYGQNLARGLFGQQFYILNHFWSLAVEEHFYLVWPLLIFLCSRRGSIAVCVGVIAAALALRLVLIPFSGQIDIYVLTPCRMDSLAVGSLLALLARGPAGLRPLVRPAAVAGVTLAAATIAWLCLKGTLEEHQDPVVTGPGFTLLALMYGSFLVLSLVADPAGAAGRAVAHPWLRFLGRYSYGIYIFHWPVVVVLGSVMKPDRAKQMLGPVAGGVAFILVAAALSIGTAFLSWHLYEKHWLKLKRFFDYRNPATQSAARS
jgi:peptidoglycan/LPS O-acetylase OafA/YrhL